MARDTASTPKTKKRTKKLAIPTNMGDFGCLGGVEEDLSSAEDFRKKQQEVKTGIRILEVVPRA